MVVDGAHAIERFNRTLKENIQTRLDAMGLDRDKWRSQSEPIIKDHDNIAIQEELVRLSHHHLADLVVQQAIQLAVLSKQVIR